MRLPLRREEEDEENGAVRGRRRAKKDELTLQPHGLGEQGAEPVKKEEEYGVDHGSCRAEQLKGEDGKPEEGRTPVSAPGPLRRVNAAARER